MNQSFMHEAGLAWEWSCKYSMLSLPFLCPEETIAAEFQHINAHKKALNWFPPSGALSKFPFFARFSLLGRPPLLPLSLEFEPFSRCLSTVSFCLFATRAAVPARSLASLQATHSMPGFLRALWKPHHTMCPMLMDSAHLTTVMC